MCILRTCVICKLLFFAGNDACFQILTYFENVEICQALAHFQKKLTGWVKAVKEMFETSWLLLVEETFLVRGGIRPGLAISVQVSPADQYKWLSSQIL